MERVLIFGATSAIASEVALLHARRGDRLHLVGRDARKLDAIAEHCRQTSTTTQIADFSLLSENENVAMTAIARLGAVDRVLIAHGDLGDQLATEQRFPEAEAVLRTNLLSVVSLLIPLANHLEASGSGRIGVITSVAGDRGRPRNYTYGTAKGALNIYLQGLRTRLYPSGIPVTTLKLGPVDTPMTRTHHKHLLFGRPAPVARAIVEAMDAGAGEVYIPGFWRVVMPLVRLMPEPLIQRLSFLSGR